MARTKRHAAVPATPNSSAPPWQATELSYLAARAHIDGADHLACEMDRKWGVGRLRLLVDPELRARFDRQRLLFNEALASGGVPDVEREAGRMVNAWNALDRAAEAAGAEKPSSTSWEVGLEDGRVLRVAMAGTGASATDGRHVEVITLEEVAKLYESFPGLVEVKQVFPGATVEAARRPDDPLEAWERQGVEDLFHAG